MANNYKERTILISDEDDDHEEGGEQHQQIQTKQNTVEQKPEWHAENTLQLKRLLQNSAQTPLCRSLRQNFLLFSLLQVTVNPDLGPLNLPLMPYTRRPDTHCNPTQQQRRLDAQHQRLGALYGPTQQQRSHARQQRSHARQQHSHERQQLHPDATLQRQRDPTNQLQIPALRQRSPAHHQQYPALQQQRLGEQQQQLPGQHCSTQLQSSPAQHQPDATRQRNPADLKRPAQIQLPTAQRQRNPAQQHQQNRRRQRQHQRPSIGLLWQQRLSFGPPWHHPTRAWRHLAPMGVSCCQVAAMPRSKFNLPSLGHLPRPPEPW